MTEAARLRVSNVTSPLLRAHNSFLFPVPLA
jgi:hypothetical protein